MSSYEVEVIVRAPFAGRVSARWLRNVVYAALGAEDQPEGAELTLLVTDDDEIEALNERYRDTDRPTDVLAFGGSEKEPFVVPEGFPIYLGDVVVSYPRAVAQAEAAGHSVKEELTVLIIHGCLHLLGYEHAGERERREMWRRQEDIKATLFANGQLSPS